MKLGKILIVASSDYLYVAPSLFWPDVVFLAAPNLDWGQPAGMAISAERAVNVNLEVVMIAGSNDHLQSRGLLMLLWFYRELGSCAGGDHDASLCHAAGREINTAMFCEANGQVYLCAVSWLCLATRSPEFVYAMVVLLVEGRFDVMIPAPNRQADPDFNYPIRSELPAIWSDMSSAIQRFKDHSMTLVVLDEGLGLELTNFRPLLKMRPGVGDEDRLVKRLANNLWFWQTANVRDERRNLVRRNALSSEEDLKAMALRTKPRTNLWLYLSPRLCTLGQHAFDDAPAVVREIHQYLKKILDAREQAGATILQLMQEIYTMSLDVPGGHAGISSQI